MAGLLQELLVCPERKISWVVDGDFQIIFQYNWMIGVIHNELCSVFLEVEPPDHTHAARENCIVTFHTHNHGNGWYISKDSYKICME